MVGTNVMENSEAIFEWRTLVGKEGITFDADWLFAHRPAQDGRYVKHNWFISRDEENVTLHYYADSEMPTEKTS